MGTIGFVSLPFGILETGGSANDPIPQLRLAGFDSCPECKTGWSDDVKKFRPIQEICGHVKCRQCFIKAVASNEDNCFQCDQIARAKEASEAASITPKILCVSTEKPLGGKCKNPHRICTRKRRLPDNALKGSESKEALIVVPKTPRNKRAVIKPDEDVPLIHPSIGKKPQVTIPFENSRDLAKINFKKLWQKKNISAIGISDTGKMNSVVPEVVKTISDPHVNPHNLSPPVYEAPSKNPDTEGKVRRKKRRPVTIPEFVKIVELTDNTPSLYHCLKCGKKFKTKAHIKYHEFCADPNLKPFVCEICDKNFIAKSHFQYHQRTHTGERPYKCPKCGKGFNQKGKVTRHMRSHTGEKPHSCLLCGKGFANLQALKSHSLIHTGERPFACDLCDKRFTGQTNLKKHLLVHTGERPFECHFCKKRFGLKWTLDLHLRTHSAEKPFACDECDRAFSNSKDLKRHKIIHTGLRPFPCKICGTAFKRKDNLERHIRMTHSRSKEDASTLSQIAIMEAKNAEISEKQNQTISINNHSEEPSPDPAVESHVDKIEPEIDPEPPSNPAFQDVLDFSSSEENLNEETNQIHHIKRIKGISEIEISAELTFKGEKPFEFLENTNHEEPVKVEEEGSTTSTSVDIFNPDSALNVDETAALCSQSMKMLLRPEESEKPPEAVSKWEEIIAGTPPEEHSDGQDTKPLIKTEADGDANSDIFDIICEHDDYEVMRF